MHLTKLRINGFKSFANRQEVNFPLDGIISVVGPNGCGKSNIVDAIRWVMGEQKVKALRSSKMEDVIFSGTADKAATNMAEVSLIINNDRGHLPDEHTQVMISRRAYRDGNSEYLINNQVCRLKDIHNLFYDTGMGAASYSLMEDRMIDSILSEKDEERRMLFEEASGISKYKKQRIETRRQLDKTSLDLERVEDNVRHTRRAVNGYENQAKKAEEWRNLTTSIKVLELTFQLDKYREMKQRFAELSGSQNQFQQKAEDLKNGIAAKEAVLEEKKLYLVAEEKTLNEFNQIVTNTNAECVSITNTMQRIKDRIGYLQESIKKKNENIHLSERKIETYAEERNRYHQQLKEAKQAFLEIDTFFTNESERQLFLQGEYETRRSLSSRLSEERVAVYEELDKIKHPLERLRTEKNMLETRNLEIVTGLKNMQDKVAELEAKKLQVTSEKASLIKQQEDIQSKLAQTIQAQQTIGDQKDKLQEEFIDLDKRKVALETQYNILKNLHDSLEGVGSGAQYLMADHKLQISGALFDMITVPDEYVFMVEKCLGEFLQTLVIEEESTVWSLLGQLKQDKKGIAIFFNSAIGSGFSRVRPDITSRLGLGGWLVDKIKYDPDLHGLMEYLLGHYLVVEDNTIIPGLIKDLKGEYWFVSPDGNMYHSSGIMRGGHYAEDDKGLLQQKAQLDKIENELEVILQQYELKSEVLNNTEEELKRLSSAKGDFQDKIDNIRQQLQDNNGRLAGIQATLESELSRQVGAQERREVIESKLGGIIEQMLPLQEQLRLGEERRQSLESNFQKAQASLHDIEQQKSEHEQKVREYEGKRSKIESQMVQARARLQHLDDSEKEQADMQLQLDLDGQEWEAETARQQSQIDELTSTIHSLNKRLESETAARDQAKAKYDTKVSELDEFRNEIRIQYEEYHSHSNQAYQTAIKLEQASSGMERIHERMYEMYEVDLTSDDPGFEPVSYNADTVEVEIESLKDKLSTLGNINVGALEEYEEGKARLEEVQKQFDDLEKAKRGLERAIRKLDKIAREQFLETFTKIQQNFQDVFATLFEGGDARISLAEGEDPLDAAILINARPTGKKMRGVTLLSGGERALTAISLLFSLYLVRPSPYCIMDEVDGPLDDANIGRFINLLRRFSQETQFIVVTHNKRTMAASDMLYGVTQEHKGISQLTSVRLDEATKLAN